MKKGYKYIIAIVILSWLFRPIGDDFIDRSFSYKVDDSSGYLLSATIADDEQWRFPISEEVPYKFEKCIVSFEDRRFYNHPGIDPLAVLRAIKQNINSQRIVSGASTITMQLSRLVSDHHQRNFWNKTKEIVFAVRLELWHSKKDILSWYTSLAPFGGNVVGLEAACWKYFRKSPNQLSWAESATLAVLPNAPSLIHVNKNRARLKKKRDFLLRKMFEEEVISDLDFDGALSESLPDKTFGLPNKASHYLQYLKKNDAPKISPTIDGGIQESVAEILNRHYLELSQNGIFNASCIVLDTRTGSVISYHGNIPNTINEASVDLVQASRSSGSILKPFLYAHMLDEGLITPKSLVLDIPTYISGFSPSNYNKSFSGAIGSDIALQRSLNIPAVRMLQSYGVDKFLHFLKMHGIQTLNNDADHYGLSLILGGGEVTLWELAHAYRNLGAVLLKGQTNKINKDIPLSKPAVFQTFEALKNLSRPNEEGNWLKMSSRVPIAWKTGTSYGHRDAWAVGVNPEVTIATWVGNADGEGRDRIVGTSTAGKLLFEILSSLDLKGEWFRTPFEELKYFNVCRTTGYLANIKCPEVDTVFWPSAVERSEVCPYHKSVFTTTDKSYRVSGHCLEDLPISEQVYLNLPPQVAEYYKTWHPEFQTIPVLHPSCSSFQEYSMDIVYPQENDDLYLPIDLNGVHQKLIARVAHKEEKAKLFWYLDQNFLGTTTHPHVLPIIPNKGPHKITVLDQNGNKVSRRFSVYNMRRP